jgi:DNA modification methylase
VDKIEFGDCREIMRKWAESGIKAQTCVTSPPYYGLRDYGHDGQIGLEETPTEYINAMVEVFRCVWDVLEDDGTVWLNIGDSYSSHKDCKSIPQSLAKGTAKENAHAIDIGKSRVRDSKMLKSQGLKNKDLIGIPWMLAFALRADGWYLRQDIIWHKPNPMPESVQDRCTKAHEYIFLLSKSQKYYYDIDAIKEQTLDVSLARMQRGVSDTHKNINGAPGQTAHSMNKPRLNMKNMQHDGQSPNSFHKSRKNGEPDEVYENRNKRSVWSVTTKPYAGAHFAVFPSDLIEPCILAGAPVGGIVLDPFMGSGTTAQVAQNLGRKYLGCELNTEYEILQRERLKQQSLELI